MNQKFNKEMDIIEKRIKTLELAVKILSDYVLNDKNKLKWKKK